MPNDVWTSEQLMPGDVAVRVWDDWHKESARHESVSWGYDWLDQSLGKLMPGALVVVGGATNMGKTLFMLGAAEGAGQPVAFVSCEDPVPEMGRRIKLYTPEQHKKLYLGVPTIPKLSRVLSLLREGHRLYGVRAFYVDYLQTIMYDSDTPCFTRMDQIRGIVQNLKALGRECGVPVILGSQLRRPKDDDSGRPTMHWLKESGDIENMAEFVLLLSGVDRVTVRCEVGKAKNAPVGGECLYKRVTGGKLEPATDLEF